MIQTTITIIMQDYIRPTVGYRPNMVGILTVLVERYSHPPERLLWELDHYDVVSLRRAQPVVAEFLVSVHLSFRAVRFARLLRVSLST